MQGICSEAWLRQAAGQNRFLKSFFHPFSAYLEQFQADSDKNTVRPFPHPVRFVVQIVTLQSAGQQFYLREYMVDC